eukprot:m.4495 g.4495  ORF g.4495 m.4495 type:complete len:102 (+) comp10840_c0_seq2:569-874(+)
MGLVRALKKLSVLQKDLISAESTIGKSVRRRPTMKNCLILMDLRAVDDYGRNQTSNTTMRTRVSGKCRSEVGCGDVCSTDLILFLVTPSRFVGGVGEHGDS